MPDWSRVEFLTVADVATVLKLNQQTVRNWIDDGRLPALRIGRRVRVTRSDLNELLRRSAYPAGAADSTLAETDRAQAFWTGSATIDAFES